MDQSENPIEDASIAIYSIVDEDGNFDVLVQNLTDDVLTIDQTKSFFVTPTKESKSYFDPTVRTTSNTTSTASENGRTFNLGGLANVLGIGGVAGTLMNATSLGQSNTIMNGTTYTEVVADLPKVSIGPRGRMAMSKTFKINLDDSGQMLNATPEDSQITFSVCITYSFDDGETYDRIVADFYCNSNILELVTNRKTNEAVRRILQKKPNATLEPWFKFESGRVRGFWSEFENDGVYNLGTFIKYQ
ncbi:MAG: hypothetical protein NC102_02995 [Clostridium sp.]|nr:hypothetical protein [Clostridium sp.]